MSHRAGLARHVYETPGRDATDLLGGSAEGDGVKWKLLLALGTLVFGMTQIQLMPGSFHWIVEVAHLGVVVVAIALGAQLANAITLGRESAGQVAESNVT